MIYTHRSSYTERLVGLVRRSVPDEEIADKIISDIYRNEHLAKLEGTK